MKIIKALVLFLGLVLGLDRQIDATPELAAMYAVPLVAAATYVAVNILTPDYSLLSDQEVEAGIQGLLERRFSLLHPETWSMSNEQYDLREQLVAVVRGNGGVGQVQALLVPGCYHEAYFRIKACEPLFKYLIAYAVNKGHVEMTELFCLYARLSGSDREYYVKRARAKEQCYQLAREWQELKEKAAVIADDVQRQAMKEWKGLKKQATAAVEEVQDAWKKLRDGAIKPEVDKMMSAGNEIMRQAQVALDSSRSAVEKLRPSMYKTEENAAAI